MYIISKFSLEQKKANITFNAHRKVLYIKVLKIVYVFEVFMSILPIL